MENIIRKRRLKWMGHVWHMDEERRAKQVMSLNSGGGRTTKELAGNHQRRLEIPENVVGVGGATGDEQR